MPGVVSHFTKTKFDASNTTKSLLFHPYPNLCFLPRPPLCTSKHTAYSTSPFRCLKAPQTYHVQNCMPVFLPKCAPPPSHLSNSSHTLHSIYSANPASSSFKHSPPPLHLFPEVPSISHLDYFKSHLTSPASTCLSKTDSQDSSQN